jgi:2-desacetyl-2-hydroxyethyl bacteriochlorophyllide A dehydrogenase
MGKTVSFTAPGVAELVDEDTGPLASGEVRIRTLYSGISAGTELTAYRGTSPFLDRHWDPEQRLFLKGSPTWDYPITGMGYEEVGEVSEIGGAVTAVKVGDRVWGTWGHRTETITSEQRAAARLLDPSVDPRIGAFSQIGAIALNVLLDADIHLGETVAVFGLGVPGQLVAQLARLSGARVIAVDGVESRRRVAAELGADILLDAAAEDVARRIRELTGGRGADVCLEVTGSYRALHEAVRSVAYNSRVCAAGFMQGEGLGLRLGEEFHHNRVQLVCAQISGVNPSVAHRWDEYRLARTFVDLAAAERVRVLDLITHEMPFEQCGDAFRLLDTAGSDVLQVVLKAEEDR